MASDPRSSSLAVHFSNGTWTMWGLVDQGNQYYSFVNFESDTGPGRPGIFEISVLGIGQIMVYRDYTKIAELRAGELLGPSLDVLQRGPVLEALRPSIDDHIDRVLRSVRDLAKAEGLDVRRDWARWLAFDWVETLSRILLRMQSFRHGGALLISRDETNRGLNIKYSLDYGRLSSALQGQAVERVLEVQAEDTIFNNHLQYPDEAEEGSGEENVNSIAESSDLSSDELMPISLYLDQAVHGNERLDAQSELLGAIWFVALLTRVDGLVLMRPNEGIA